MHMNRRQAVRTVAPGAQAHTAHLSLVMGVWEIIGTVNLTFLIKFPLADNFQGWPPIFFKSIHGPQRAVQLSKNEILKLHTILEIFASNPILKTHFFELGEFSLCKTVMFYEPVCSTKLHKCWTANVKNNFFKGLSNKPLTKRFAPLRRKFKGNPKFLRPYIGTVEPYKFLKTGV